MMVTQSHTYSTQNWAEAIVLTFVYASYILIIGAPIGFIISAYKVYQFKRLAKNGSVDNQTLTIATHHEWLVRTFITAMIMVMVALGLLYYFVGFIVAGIAAIWWSYRLIRGVVALITHRPMPAIICTQAVCYGEVASL